MASQKCQKYSEMYVLCVRIPPNLDNWARWPIDNWARWPISSSADCSQRRKKTTVTRHFYTYNALHKAKYETNLHQTPSSYKRLPIQRSSSDHLQQQLLRHSPWAASAFWCRVPRRCHASFGRTRGVAPRPLHEKKIRNQAATARATSPYPIGSLLRNSVSSNLIGKKWKKSRQNCFASSMLPMLLAYDGITNLKGNKHVLHILAFFPLSAPMAASKTPKHHTRRRFEKTASIVYIVLASNDVPSILAMLHFGGKGKGDYELTLSYAISLWESVPVTGSILSHFQARLDNCKFTT